MSRVWLSRRRGFTTLEQALLLLFIVVSAIAIWQNFERQVTSATENGGDALQHANDGVSADDVHDDDRGDEEGDGHGRGGRGRGRGQGRGGGRDHERDQGQGEGRPDREGGRGQGRGGGPPH